MYNQIIFTSYTYYLCNNTLIEIDSIHEEMVSTKFSEILYLKKSNSPLKFENLTFAAFFLFEAHDHGTCMLESQGCPETTVCALSVTSIYSPALALEN